MDKTDLKGFTLIELLVTLAVAAILLGVGVPSLMTTIQSGRMSSDYNKLVGALYLARSEAVKSARDVTVCPRASRTSEQCGTDWANGFLVFVDSAVAANETTANVGDNDELLGIEKGVAEGTSITGVGSSDRTASGASARNFIRYSANGSTDWSNGSFVLCDERGEDFARAVNIVLTGDIRRGRPANGATVPRDVFNRTVDCPDST